MVEFSGNNESCESVAQVKVAIRRIRAKEPNGEWQKGGEEGQ